MADLSPGAKVALGVLVGLVSTCVQSIGLTQQRKSHLLEEQRQAQNRNYVHRPAYWRRRWQLGMLMFLISNIVGSSIQITLLPLPVLATLQASGLVFNTTCATLVLGEPFTRYSLIGTCLVAAGAVLIGIFGSVTEPPHNLAQLLNLLGRGGFLAWLFSTFFLVLVLAVGMFLIKRVHPRQTHGIRLLRGMTFGAISGILSAHTLLVAKSAVELLVRTLVDRVNQFNQWQSWMILLGLVTLALLQLYFLHRGLKLCSTSVLYPFVFCIYNIIAILDGLIYFDQSSRLPLRDAALIAVGTAVLLGGVVALSWRLQADDDLPGPSVVDVTAKARVMTPRTILQPGLGIQPGADSESEADDEELYRSPVGDEEALPEARRVHITESTPLLRSKTLPRRRKDLTSPELRPPKIRRMTTIQDEGANHLWNDLNDRSGIHDFSAQTSPLSVRSPTAMRSQRHRSASGPRKTRTIPSSRRSTSNSLSKLPWRILDRRAAGRRGDSSPDLGSPPPADGTDTECEDLAASRESEALVSAESSGHARRASAGEARPGWLKMKWWKKRRREDGDTT